MGMDRKLFEPKPSIFIILTKALFYVIVWVLMILLIPYVTVTSFMWLKETKFVNEQVYRLSLEEQYNKGRFHERMCAIILKDRKEPLSLTQKSFCDRHNNYKDHPQELGG